MSDATAEHWLPVVGWEGLYEVSDLGRVRSLPRRGAKRPRMYGGKILEPYLSDQGYRTVALCYGGKQKTQKVHQLVAAAFLGLRPVGMETLHGPEGKLVNTPVNLRYGTSAENTADMFRDGTIQMGTSNSSAKLTEDIVLECRRRYAAGGVTSAVLAAEFGLSPRAMRKVISGARWGHVGAAYQGSPGERTCKLTEDAVRECRARYATGQVTQAALARAYGVSATEMHNVVRGKRWGRLSGEAI